MREARQVVPPDAGRADQVQLRFDLAPARGSVANAVADSFIDTAIQRRYESSAYARNFLERQINKTRGDLERSERSLVAYAQAQGIINTSTPGGQQGGGHEFAAGRIAGQAERSACRRNRAAGRGRRRLPPVAGDRANQRGHAEHAWRCSSSLPSFRRDYQQKRTFMKPDHPEMVSLRSQIDELQRQIAKEQAQVSSGRSNSLACRLSGRALGRRGAPGARGAAEGRGLNLRGRSIQYTILQREVDTNRALYDALLQRYKQIGVAGGVGIAPVSIVDRADVPQLPFKPNLFLNLLLGLGLGLARRLAGAIGLEFINDTIKSREDVRKKLSLAVPRVVPRTPAKDAFVEDLKNPTSIDLGSLFRDRRGAPVQHRIGHAEGLSADQHSSRRRQVFFGARARAEFCAARKSVLLIDGDLRKPAFKAASETGRPEQASDDR